MMDDKGDHKLIKSLIIVESHSGEENMYNSHSERELNALDHGEYPKGETSSTLDDSTFSAHGKYAGSFRLRFSASGSRAGHWRLATSIQDTAAEANSITDSLTSVNFADSEQKQNDGLTPTDETQEVSLKFTVDHDDSEDIIEDEVDLEISNQSNHHPVQHNQEQTSPDCGDSGELSEVQGMNPLNDHDISTQRDGSPTSVVVSEQPLQSQAKELIETEVSSVGGESDTEQTQESGSDKFFFSPEEEPVLNPDFKRRAKRAVESVVCDQLDESEDKKTNTCAKYCYLDCCDLPACRSKSPKIPPLTVEMKNASSQGFSMLRKLLFPAMPKFLTDILVLAEFGVTVTQFILSLISVSIENNRAYNITYIVVASIALLLALIDAFIYFVQLGSCARIFRYCYSKQRKSQGRKTDYEEDSEHERHEKRCCQFLSPKVKSWLAQAFELLRTLLSELLIYPLVILDLFDLIVGGTYLRQTNADRINFSLFVIGSTFLVLSVYFTRTFMVISAAINIRRTPLDPTQSKSSMIDLVTQFCVHVIFQIIVHIAIIIIVGVKIFQENPTPCADFESSCTFMSPFLLYTIIVGGMLPLYGTGVFFIIKYYNLRELSIGFWVNMLALLQSESFATAVFAKKGIEESKERAKHVIEKIKYEDVKHQLMSFKMTPTWIKVLYPLRFPMFVAIAALYEVLLLSFIVCLALSVDSNGQVQLVLFDNGLSSAAICVAVLILIANLHVLILTSLWILSALVLIILFLLLPIVWIIIVLCYIPSIIIIGLFHCVTRIVRKNK